MARKRKALFLIPLLLCFAVLLQAGNVKLEAETETAVEKAPAASGNEVSAQFCGMTKDDFWLAEASDYILRVHVIKAEYKDRVVFLSSDSEEAILAMPVRDYEARVVEVLKAPKNVSVEEKVIISVPAISGAPGLGKNCEYVLCLYKSKARRKDEPVMTNAYALMSFNAGVLRYSDGKLCFPGGISIDYDAYKKYYVW